MAWILRGEVRAGTGAHDRAFLGNADGCGGPRRRGTDTLRSIRSLQLPATQHAPYSLARSSRPAYVPHFADKCALNGHAGAVQILNNRPRLQQKPAWTWVITVTSDKSEKTKQIRSTGQR